VVVERGDGRGQVVCGPFVMCAEMTVSVAGMMFPVVVAMTVRMGAMKMRSLAVGVRLCNAGPVVRMCQAQRVVGQHERNKQQTDDSASHES
jgi:hypothetical protein